MKFKAQIWSFDFAVSMVIFITALILVLSLWSYANSQTNEQLRQEKLQDLILTVSDVLVRSEGSPENWTKDDVKIIGLASREKVLDPDKISEFMQIPYDTARQLLGTGSFNFHFQLSHANETVMKLGGNDIAIGLSPANTSIVAPVERYVLFNGEIVKARMVLWQ